jgi:hypothetical protein
MSHPWRLSLQAWIGLLTLGLTLWLTITYAGLVLSEPIVHESTKER